MHLREFPCVLLIGARQVGKTTLTTLPQFSQGRTFLTFDDPEVLATAKADPEAFLDQAEKLTIDEVQRLPGLFTRIKKRIDRDRVSGRFLLTGSSATHLVQGAHPSLAGRASILEMGPLTLSELKGGASIDWRQLLTARSAAEALKRISLISPAPAHILEQRILRGGLPPAFQFRKDTGLWLDWMRSYRSLYLDRDVLPQRRLGLIEDFLRVMAHMAWRTAQNISLSGVSRDAGVPVSSVAVYLRLLEQSCQWIRLPAYHRNLGKRLQKTPKGYWFDSGVAAFLMGVTHKDQATQQQRWGALFETWLVNELKTAHSIYPEISGLYHWRTQTGLEVDIVIEGMGRILPVECKSGRTLGHELSSGMRAFLSLFRKDAPFGLILYGGTEPQLLPDNVVALPACMI